MLTKTVGQSRYRHSNEMIRNLAYSRTTSIGAASRGIPLKCCINTGCPGRASRATLGTGIGPAVRCLVQAHTGKR